MNLRMDGDRRGSGAGDRTRAWAWPAAVAAVVGAGAVAVAAVAGFATLRQCTPAEVVRAGGDEARRTLRTLADALRPAAVTSPLVVLRGEDRTPKLVVYTHAADVAVDLVQDTWYGDTFSRVEAKGCRAQFVVAVDRMTDRDVVFVPGGGGSEDAGGAGGGGGGGGGGGETRGASGAARADGAAGAGGRPARILVLAPRPRVDAEMLAVAPESIEFTERNTGLRRARGWMGLDNREELVKALRPQLLEAMGDAAVRARAEEAGREFFEKRFAEWLRGDLQLGRDVEVDVRWVE